MHLPSTEHAFAVVVDLLQRLDAPLDGEGVAMPPAVVLNIPNCLLGGKPNNRRSWKCEVITEISGRGGAAGGLGRRVGEGGGAESRSRV